MVDLREFDIIIPNQRLVELPLTTSTFIDMYKTMCVVRCPHMEIRHWQCPVHDHIHAVGRAPTPLITLYMAVIYGHNIKMIVNHLSMQPGFGLGEDDYNLPHTGFNA